MEPSSHWLLTGFRTPDRLPPDLLCPSKMWAGRGWARHWALLLDLLGPRPSLLTGAVELADVNLKLR